MYAYGGDKAWMTIDTTDGPGRNNVYSNWNRSYSCCSGDFVRSVDRGQTYGDLLYLPGAPFWGTLSVGPDGELYIVGNGFVIIKSTNAQDPAATPEFDDIAYADLGGFLVVGEGPNPEGLLGQAWIATDHSNGPNRGNVYLLASVRGANNDPADIMFARSTDGGFTWSQPIRINDDPPGNRVYQWFGTMSVSPNGRIDAIWNDNRIHCVTRLTEMYHSYSLDGGLTWSPNTPVTPMFDSHLGWPRQEKLGDYYDMISDHGGAHVAFAATFNGEQDVYYLRIRSTATKTACLMKRTSPTEPARTATATVSRTNAILSPSTAPTAMPTSSPTNASPTATRTVSLMIVTIAHHSPMPRR